MKEQRSLYPSSPLRHFPSFHISELNKKGKLPIIVGGTHYYIQSLIWDSLLETPEGPEPSRERADESDLESKSTEELYAMLQEVDPETQQHPNQRKRILSDLHLFNRTGVAPSVLRRQYNKEQSKEEQLENVVIWLSCPTSVLAQRLNKRVDSMVQAGMLEENTAFVNRYLEGSDVTRGVWQAIGLKEFMPLYVDEEGRSLHHEKVDTQQYAKRWALSGGVSRRQITWIRNRLQARVQHMIQLDTSQLDRWDDVVYTPAMNVVQHLIDGTLPRVDVNHAHWEQQSES